MSNTIRVFVGKSLCASGLGESVKGRCPPTMCNLIRFIATCLCHYPILHLTSRRLEANLESLEHPGAHPAYRWLTLLWSHCNLERSNAVSV